MILLYILYKALIVFLTSYVYGNLSMAKYLLFNGCIAFLSKNIPQFFLKNPLLMKIFAIKFAFYFMCLNICTRQKKFNSIKEYLLKKAILLPTLYPQPPL